jgi:hypothetical protein
MINFVMFTNCALSKSRVVPKNQNKVVQRNQNKILHKTHIRTAGRHQTEKHITDAAMPSFEDDNEEEG